MGQRRSHEASSFAGPDVSLFQQDPICLGPSMKISYKQICILSHHLFSESDPVFRLTQSVLYFLSLGVLTALVFVLHPDSLMMSGACLKSGSMSRYCPVRSTPTRNTRFNNRSFFRVSIVESKCSHVFRCVRGFEKSVDVFESIIV